MAQITYGTISPKRKDKFKNLVIDYSLDRPFSDWSYENMLSCLNAALRLENMNLEIASLIWYQLRNMGDNHAEAKRLIINAGGNLVPWLKGVRFRIKSLEQEFKPSGDKPRNCNVYFILLTQDRNTPLPWGIYIGTTVKKIEDRFTIHLDDDDPHRSRKVNKRGWQILYSLSSIVPAMTRSDIERFEKKALASLRGELTSKNIRGLGSKRVLGA